jgi:hypothetical protein
MLSRPERHPQSCKCAVGFHDLVNADKDQRQILFASISHKRHSIPQSNVRAADLFMTSSTFQFHRFLQEIFAQHTQRVRWSRRSVSVKSTHHTHTAKVKSKDNVLFLSQQLHSLQQNPSNLAIQVLSRRGAMGRCFLGNGWSGVRVLGSSSRGDIVAIGARGGSGSCRHWAGRAVRCAWKNCRRLKGC